MDSNGGWPSISVAGISGFPPTVSSRHIRTYSNEKKAVKWKHFEPDANASVTQGQCRPRGKHAADQHLLQQAHSAQWAQCEPIRSSRGLRFFPLSHFIAWCSLPRFFKISPKTFYRGTEGGGEMESTGNRAICSICYEELKPIVEDIQAVSVCGHVFHEIWYLSFSLSLFEFFYLALYLLKFIILRIQKRRNGFRSFV